MPNNFVEKNIEVEVRALVKTMTVLQDKLISESGKYHGEYCLHDIYFCRKDCARLEEVEMNEINSYGLRLRKSKDYDGKKETLLNSKTITRKGDHNAWEEHEVMVSDFMETAKILMLTEFKPFFELKKTRHHYTLDSLDIFIEDIKDFGCCVEVEKMTTPGKEDEAKNQIFKLLGKLGIEKKSIVPKSVTNLIMKERAFKKTVVI